ncbi:MAG: hypothetical protein ACRC1S_10610 [Vibrio sp.]
MPVKGVSHIKGNVGRWVAEISGNTTQKVLLTIGMNASAYATLATPVDHDTLINSKYYELINGGKTVVVGFREGFTKKGFNYGFYLHENVDWKPVKKKNATHHYLSNAFELPEYRQDHIKTIINGYKL